MRARVLSTLLQTRKLLCQRFSSHKNNSITYSQLRQSVKYCTGSLKKLNENDNSLEEEEEEGNLTIPGNSKYKVFHDEDAEIVFDVNEEQQRVSWEELNAESEAYDPYEGLNMQRGVRGVIDIEDLVMILQRDNAKDIFVAEVPAKYSYVDYIVVVTGKSRKHMQALATFIRKMYKLKKHKTDILPKIEGIDSKDWIALDLGNIALHIFSKSARVEYDLETLWSVGGQHDDKSNITPNTSFMEQYNAFLMDMEPADVEDIKNENT